MFSMQSHEFISVCSFKAYYNWKVNALTQGIFNYTNFNAQNAQLLHPLAYLNVWHDIWQEYFKKTDHTFCLGLAANSHLHTTLITWYPWILSLINIVSWCAISGVLHSTPFTLFFMKNSVLTAARKCVIDIFFLEKYYFKVNNLFVF